MTASARDATLTDLAARLAAFDLDGEPGVLLDLEAQRRASALSAEVLAARTSAGDVGLLRVLGRWFLRRYEALPAGSGRADLRAARLYAGLLRDLGDDALTDDLRALLTGEPDLAIRTSETALSLLGEFEATGDERRVMSAGLLIRSLEEMLPADHPLRGELLSTSAQFTSALFTIHGDPAHMDATLRTLREAADGGDPDDPHTVDKHAMMAWTLLTRYEHSADPADLEEALAVAERLLGRDPGRPAPNVAALLSTGLRMRFERSPRVSDLDRAVALSRDAIRTTPSGHPVLVDLRQNLALCLVRRFEHLNQPDDLTEATDVIRAVQPMLGPAGPIRCAALTSLAILLLWRGIRTGSAADLDEAAERSREATALAEKLGAIRHWVLGNHATVLSTRFLAAGRPEDLAEAIRACREAVAAGPPGGLRDGVNRSTLSRLLTMDVTRGGGADGLDEALEVGRQAVSSFSPGHPLRVIALGNLAEAYERRHRITGAAADLETAVGLWRSAARSPAGRPDSRMAAARQWMAALLRNRDLAGAFEAAAAAVALLPVLAWRGLDRTGQERRLAGLGGLAGTAAALAVELDRPREAVELVEQGRSVLWAQAVQTRSDLSSLRAAAPGLADHLDRTRMALNRTAGKGEAGIGDQDTMVRDYRKLVERWDSLLAEARALPGFAGFLGATPFDTLREAAADGSVVIVNVSLRCDALIVRRDGVRVVRLPWLSLADAHRRADSVLSAITETEPGGSGPAWTHLRQTMTSLLRWLWDAVAAPVLDALDELEPVGPHRVWWCPTGPLTLLPLHAAGRYGTTTRWHERRRPTVPDRTVSSYTPGLGALARARNAAAPAGDRTLLAVGMPHTPGRAPLPAVMEEVGRIAEAVPGTRSLIAAAASPDAVLAGLARHPWAHFACHATQRVDQPGLSALHLTGGDLSVLRLAGQELTGAELAYLSACRTAGGSLALADEAINLAAALQLAGYRHVIGTLWSVADTHAATVAEAVYRRITRSGRPDASQAGAALTAATAELRAQYPDRPEIWAPFVHLGP